MTRKYIVTPWVGKEYNQGGYNSKKILMIGESHYEWEKDQTLERNLTIRCIEDQLEGYRLEDEQPSENRKGYTKPFFSQMVNSFIGKDAKNEQKKNFCIK